MHMKQVVVCLVAERSCVLVRMKNGFLSYFDEKSCVWSLVEAQLLLSLKLGMVELAILLSAAEWICLFPHG